LPLKTHQITNMNEIKNKNKKRDTGSKKTKQQNVCELMDHQENNTVSHRNDREYFLRESSIIRQLITQSAEETKHHNVDISEEFIKTS